MRALAFVLLLTACPGAHPYTREVTPCGIRVVSDTALDVARVESLATEITGACEVVSGMVLYIQPTPTLKNWQHPDIIAGMTDCDNGTMILGSDLHSMAHEFFHVQQRCRTPWPEAQDVRDGYHNGWAQHGLYDRADRFEDLLIDDRAVSVDNQFR